MSENVFWLGIGFLFSELSKLERKPSEVVRRTICGIIKFVKENQRLEQDDVVVVSLCDTTMLDWTRIDFPHIPKRYVVSDVRIEGNQEFPIPFTLYYDAEEVDLNLCYGLWCDVFDKNRQIKYASERFISVLTDQYPKTNVHLVVIPCGDDSSTNTNTTKT